MAARPSWEGHLRLSLVTCPVALWPATSEADTVRFNMINPKTNNRIRMQTIDAGTGEEVSQSRPDARDRLEQLRADQRAAKAELREVLESLAERHGIAQKDINYAIDGYADDMLSDVVYSVERDLEHVSEAASVPLPSIDLS